MRTYSRLLHLALAILLFAVAWPPGVVFPDQPGVDARAGGETRTETGLPAGMRSGETPDQPGTPPPPVLQPGGRVVLVVDPRHSPFRVVSSVPKGLRVQSSTFLIHWNPDSCSVPGSQLSPWPAEAKTAFSHAVGVWSTLITSRVPIEVDACWAGRRSGWG